MRKVVLVCFQPLQLVEAFASDDCYRLTPDLQTTLPIGPVTTHCGPTPTGEADLQRLNSAAAGGGSLE